VSDVFGEGVTSRHDTTRNYERMVCRQRFSFPFPSSGFLRVFEGRARCPSPCHGVSFVGIDQVNRCWIASQVDGNSEVTEPSIAEWWYAKVFVRRLSTTKYCSSAGQVDALAAENRTRIDAAEKRTRIDGVTDSFSRLLLCPRRLMSHRFVERWRAARRASQDWMKNLACLSFARCSRQAGSMPSTFPSDAWCPPSLPCVVA